MWWALLGDMGSDKKRRCNYSRDKTTVHQQHRLITEDKACYGMVPTPHPG
jgi:hypothetical protein